MCSVAILIDNGLGFPPTALCCLTVWLTWPIIELCELVLIEVAMTPVKGLSDPIGPAGQTYTSRHLASVDQLIYQQIAVSTAVLTGIYTAALTGIHTGFDW